MAWWSERAAELQSRGMGAPRDSAAETYDEIDERVAIIHTRQDIVLIYSQVDSLNHQARTAKWLLAAITCLLAFIAYRLA